MPLQDENKLAESATLKGEIKTTYSWSAIFWSGVVPGIISSVLILWIIGPITNIVFNLATGSFASVAHVWVDRSISQAALGNPEIYSFMTLQLICVPYLGNL